MGIYLNFIKVYNGLYRICIIYNIYYTGWLEMFGAKILKITYYASIKISIRWHCLVTDIGSTVYLIPDTHSKTSNSDRILYRKPRTFSPVLSDPRSLNDQSKYRVTNTHNIRVFLRDNTIVLYTYNKISRCFWLILVIYSRAYTIIIIYVVGTIAHRDLD